MKKNQSLPSWERGLKSVCSFSHARKFSSLPSWERGLKYDDNMVYTTELVSLPSWERGLKSQTEATGIQASCVAPLVGARIEIPCSFWQSVPSLVAPLVGARIEIPLIMASPPA